MSDPEPLRILITAGPTREYLDPVRYISNDSSGQMGFALAAAARRRGHRVMLIHGPVRLRPPKGVHAVAITSARELLAACRNVWDDQDVLIMAAAVSDYAPAHRHRYKHKKSPDGLTIALRPAPDVLATLARRRRSGQTIVGFALEDRDARRCAAEKLRRKRLDAIVLNAPAAIGAPDAAVEFLPAGGDWQPLPPATKTRVAGRLIALIEALRENAT